MTKSTSAPKTTAPKTTPESDRLSESDFEALIETIKTTTERTESYIQTIFMAAWRDLACSHSCERLGQLWDALAETKSPYRAQVSLAMRALAGMAAPSKASQKWTRTGRAPLILQEGVWILHLEDEDKVVLKDRATWKYHFRAIQVKAAKADFTWQEVALFVKRIGVATKQNRIPEKDLKRFQELLGEIERISAR